MVEVEVGEHDVAHVGAIETQPLDLARRRHLLAEIRADQSEEEPAQAAARVGHVAQPEPGIDQHQALARLHEQAMAAQVPAFEDVRRTPVHQPPAKRTGGDAVEVMHAHVGLPCRRPESGAPSVSAT